MVKSNQSRNIISSIIQRTISVVNDIIRLLFFLLYCNFFAITQSDFSWFLSVYMAQSETNTVSAMCKKQPKRFLKKIRFTVKNKFGACSIQRHKFLFNECKTIITLNNWFQNKYFNANMYCAISVSRLFLASLLLRL
jgi:hypothetical protein